MPAAPVVAVLNTKGGSGKTTLAVNVATCLHRQIRSEPPPPGRGGVAVLDTDAPQHTAADWRARAARPEEKTLPEVQTAGTPRELRERAEDLRARRAAVFVDGAGSLEGMTGAAVGVATVALIPARPSPLDLWGTRDLVDVIKARQERTGGKPVAAFVISQAVAQANISAQAAEALGTLALPTLDARTGQRVAYAETMMRGGTVLDRPSSKAAAEVRRITSELNDLLKSYSTE